MAVLATTADTAPTTTGTPSAPGVATHRTVDRRLVHRAALAEVFLTDFLRVDHDTFRAAAQLPPSHFYYGDHTVRPATHDPLAVFEAVRQMLLCAMHLQHGAGDRTKSITAEAGLEITDPWTLTAEGRPLDLSLHGRVALEKTYQGATSRVVHEVEVCTAGGDFVGTVRVDTALRPDDAYQALRMAYRTDPPPSSDALPDAAPAEPVPPHLVGREHARNVVLQAVRTAPGEVSALLRLPVRHSSMFDHAQDHVPGPVMMEAARQATVLLAGECLGLAPSKLWLRSMRAGYARFAELDGDIVVRARLLPDGADAACHAEVAFVQAGETAATMDVRLDAVPAPGRAGAQTAVAGGARESAGGRGDAR
jgi:hypothetical protein